MISPVHPPIRTRPFTREEFDKLLNDLRGVVWVKQKMGTPPATSMIIGTYTSSFQSLADTMMVVVTEGIAKVAYSLEGMYQTFVFLDGSPFGVTPTPGWQVYDKIDLNNLEEINKEIVSGEICIGGSGCLTTCCKTLNQYAAEVHEANQKWWHDPATGLPIIRNKAEMIALIHSELSEALEGYRKDLMDDKLPHRKMEEVEMADVVIRVFDYCAGHKLDLHSAYLEKMEYNRTRKDHTPEERLKPNGKKI